MLLPDWLSWGAVFLKSILTVSAVSAVSCPP